MIQCAWRRWLARRAAAGKRRDRTRHCAAARIQLAWRVYVRRVNVTIEEEFGRWIQQRRRALFGKAKVVLRQVLSKLRWGIGILGRFGRRCLFALRRRSQFLRGKARRIQRWYRRILHQRRSVDLCLACCEEVEQRRYEVRLRRLRVKSRTVYALPHRFDNVPPLLSVV